MTTLLADYSAEAIFRRFIGFAEFTNNTELVPNLSVGFFWDEDRNIAAIINMVPNLNERYTVIASMELEPVLNLHKNQYDTLIFSMEITPVKKKSKYFKIIRYWQREPAALECVDPYNFDKKTPNFDVPKLNDNKTLFVYMLEGLASLELNVVNLTNNNE